MTVTIEVTMDAVDADAAVAFWTAALGYHALYARGPYTVLGSFDDDGRPGWSGLRLLIQRVDTVTGDKTPVHLDLRVDDPDAEVERLKDLGASVVWEVDESPENNPGCLRWTVMRDPLGTHFCVCPARR